MMDWGDGRQDRAGWAAVGQGQGCSLAEGLSGAVGTAQILLDSQLLGYRLEEMWTFTRSSERDRAARLGMSGFLLRRGRRVLRLFEGGAEVMERAREEILAEERELGHALSAYLGASVSKKPLFTEAGLRVVEPDEGTFGDLLSFTTRPPSSGTLGALIGRVSSLERVGRLSRTPSLTASAF